ncbi:beta-lactamase family protein [Bacillus sp. NP157]|nr:beta-lactamase family protein [Bacillus sp. NP157]
MKRWFVAIGLLLGSSASIVHAAPVPPAPSRAAIDAQLQANAATHGIPAQAVLVMHNAELVYRGTTGTTSLGDGKPVTSRTVFPIYSVSKLFTNTLVHQLAEEGKIDLAAPASRYVPELPPAWRAITIEQFLNHQSGVPDFFDPKDLSRPFPPTLRAVFETLGQQPMLFDTGMKTRYTGTNYLVLEAVLEAVTHKPYRQLLTERIIEPLHLRHTWLDEAKVPKGDIVASYHAEGGKPVPDAPVAWPDYAIAQGCIYASLDDVATFVSAVANGRFVSKPGWLRYWQPNTQGDGVMGGFESGWDFGQSEGGWHEVGHDGGTKVRVRILYRDNLDDHYVVVYLTNGNGDDVWSRTLLDSVQALVVPGT